MTSRRSPISGWRRLPRVVRVAAITVTAIFVLAQLVPYGRDHDNPPVTAAAPWPDAESAALVRTACYDCHSNETRWPPESHVAPFSWLIQRDVDEARAAMNFSEWERDDNEADDAAEEVADGTMPPRRYLLAHPDARLSNDERRLLVRAFEAMAESD